MSIVAVFSRKLTEKQLTMAAYAVIVIFSLIPLFLKFPYRVNIYLSWEGAYRLSNGEVPYRDFGLPLGFGFWLIPALFFKLFGPSLITLVKAQVVVNILSGISFFRIISKFIQDAGLRFVLVILFLLSFSLFNFWPWYNHTVIVYQLISLALLLEYAFSDHKYRLVFLFGSALFGFLSFFTKQDGGGLCLMLNLALMGYFAIVDKTWKGLAWFIGFYALVAMAFILPFVPHGFGYWFNVGQEPHNSRFSLFDLITEIAGGSMWEKFYFCVVVILAYLKGKNNLQSYFFDKKEFSFFLVTIGILVEALIFQVTSYIPPDNNIFFHSFACAFIFYHVLQSLDIQRLPALVAGLIVIFIWWSGVYWKYLNGTVMKLMNVETTVDYSQVSKKSWRLPDPNEVKRGTENIGNWVYCDIAAFRNVSMPKQTVAGMKRLLSSDVYLQNKGNLKVLNMTELTPLAAEMGYGYESGLPLWYHKGVGIFDREINKICDNIANDRYDIVLFEHIEVLNNFYAFDVQDCLKEHYQLMDQFPAPRPRSGTIEVYIKKLQD